MQTHSIAADAPRAQQQGARVTTRTEPAPLTLSIEGIGKRYGRDTWGLRDLSLQLSPGVVGLLGPNGAGKSTLMRILATITTTPLRRPLYTVGKWLSNLTVLVVMVGVTAVATAVLQFALGEDRQLDLVALWSPMLWVVLPTLGLVAALAVLFETIAWLRGGLGNVIYFFLSTALIMGSFLPVMMSVGDLAEAVRRE